MKTIISIVIVIALLFLGYWYYSAPAPASNELLVSSSGTGNNAVGQKIISLLSEMQNITIDQSIFTTPTFQSLLDFGVEIRPELIGRHDPFAPIGFESGTVSQGSTATGTPKTSH